MAKSPRFLDSSSGQPKQPHIIEDKFKPAYTEQLICFLQDPEFISKYGNLILGLLESSTFWRGLQRRLDFYVYHSVVSDTASIMTSNCVSPRENEPITADLLFSSVEKEVLKVFSNPRNVICDELFRLYVLLIKEGIGEQETSAYRFFVEPYFSSDVFGEANDVGQIWMEELTTE